MNGYCDEPVTVVADLFAYDKVTRQFDIREKKKPPSTTKDTRRCLKWTQFAQILNAVLPRSH